MSCVRGSSGCLCFMRARLFSTGHATCNQLHKGWACLLVAASGALSVAAGRALTASGGGGGGLAVVTVTGAVWPLLPTALRAQSLPQMHTDTVVGGNARWTNAGVTDLLPAASRVHSLSPIAELGFEMARSGLAGVVLGFTERREAPVHGPPMLTARTADAHAVRKPAMLENGS